MQQSNMLTTIVLPLLVIIYPVYNYISRIDLTLHWVETFPKCTTSSIFANVYE